MREEDGEEDTEGWSCAQADSPIGRHRYRGCDHLGTVKYENIIDTTVLTNIDTVENIPGEIDGTYKCDLTGDICPTCNPTCQGGPSFWGELGREIIETCARAAERANIRDSFPDGVLYASKLTASQKQAQPWMRLQASRTDKG